MCSHISWMSLSVQVCDWFMACFISTLVSMDYTKALLTMMKTSMMQMRAFVDLEVHVCMDKKSADADVCVYVHDNVDIGVKVDNYHYHYHIPNKHDQDHDHDHDH